MSLGFAAFATNAGLDPLLWIVSVMTVGIVASLGSVVFFMSAFRRR